MKWVMGTGTVCDNRLNSCEVGDGDRYCCENRLNCCEVRELGDVVVVVVVVVDVDDI